MVDETIEMTGEADYRLLSLVMSLATAAWSQLGKVPHPVTQKIERDLDQARVSIEFLRMLHEKTEGNLSVKEQELLDNTIADLELNFADEVRKSESKEEAKAGAAAPGKGPEIIVPATEASAGQGPEIIKP
jgi:hypothetical protein